MAEKRQQQRRQNKLRSRQQYGDIHHEYTMFAVCSETMRPVAGTHIEESLEIWSIDQNASPEWSAKPTS
jgi:hypothetical protein